MYFGYLTFNYYLFDMLVEYKYLISFINLSEQTLIKNDCF